MTEIRNTEVKNFYELYVKTKKAESKLIEKMKSNEEKKLYLKDICSISLIENKDYKKLYSPKALKLIDELQLQVKEISDNEKKKLDLEKVPTLTPRLKVTAHKK